MYVKFDIPHIFSLSNISIVLRPTMTVVTLKLYFVLVCRGFLVFLFVHISPGVCVRPVEFVLNIIYLPPSPNEEYTKWIVIYHMKLKYGCIRCSNIGC